MGWGKNKFHAVRTADGFPSKLEASVYQILLLRQRAGEIGEIRRQHRVDLPFGIKWKCDFSFELVQTGELVFAEAKGKVDQRFRDILTMWESGAGQGRLEIWTGHWRNPKLTRIIEPDLQPKCPTCGK